MPFESSYIFFTEHQYVRRSFKLRKNVTGVCSAKVDSSYYCDVLNQGLLPGIRKLSGHNFTFQQDGAPAHRSQQTVAFFASSCVRICRTQKLADE